MMPLVCAYCPVRKLARLGEQSGVVANAFVNLAPSRASRSMCGVSMNGWPTLRISSQRMSSTSTTTMLGRRDGAADGEAFCGVMSGRLQAPNRSATAKAAPTIQVAASEERRRVPGVRVRPLDYMGTSPSFRVTRDDVSEIGWRIDGRLRRAGRHFAQSSTKPKEQDARNGR